MVKRIVNLLLLCFGLLPISVQAQNESVSTLSKALNSIHQVSTQPHSLDIVTNNSNGKAKSELEEIEFKLNNAGRNDSKSSDNVKGLVNDEQHPASKGIDKNKWKITLNPKLQSFPKAPSKRVKGKIVLGNLAARDSSAYDGLRGATMELFKDANGQYYVTHVCALDDTIKINIDEDNGTVSIPPQVAFKNRFYTFYIYAADWATHSYNPDVNINGTLTPEGTIKLGSWGIFRKVTDTSIAVLNGFTNSDWTPATINSSFITKNSAGALGDTVRFISIVEQTAPKEIAIINFINNGRTVYGRITPDKKIIVSPQLLNDNFAYGQNFGYATDSTGTNVNAKGDIIGTYKDDGTITFDNFIVASQSDYDRVALRATQYSIKSSTSITWPKTLDVHFEGEGTASSPYLLKTPTDFEALSQSVEDGQNYADKYFQIANDIDFSSVQSYQPIGNENIGFAGYIDGNNKTLKGLKIVNRGSQDYGLFGNLANTSTVKDLTLDEFNIQGSGSYAGTLAGEAHGIIDNVKVTNLNMNITGAYAGGITGYNRYGEIKNSYLEGNIAANGSVGGISGCIAGSKVDKCHVKATLVLNGAVNNITNNCIGGISSLITIFQKDTAYISNCYVSGQIIDNTGYSDIGGIAGLIGKTKINKCFNIANIFAKTQSKDNDKSAGGLIGSALASTIEDCYNAGAVVKTGNSEKTGGITGLLMMTYIIGLNYTGPTDLSHFTNCYNSGIVIANPSTDNTHLGIYGSEESMGGYKPSEHYFTNCYSDKTTTALKDSVWGKTTDELTNGTLPEGFSSTIWQVNKGFYPVFKDNSSTLASQISASNLQYKPRENSAKFMSVAAIRKSSNLKAQLYDNNTDSFVQETNLLKISKDSLYEKSDYGEGILSIGDANGFEARLYVITAVPKVFQGDGTKESPYLIRNAEDYKKLNEAVYVHEQNCEGDYFKQTNDIDFTNTPDFNGVGYGEKARTTLRSFDGNFDGGGHHIKGLYIKSYSLRANSTEIYDSCYNYGALFRIVENPGSVHDLVIDKDNTFRLYQKGGSVVGFLSGKVYNVKNYADVMAYRGETGGIVGQVDTTGVVSNCYNAGLVIGGTQYLGGIAGKSLGTIDGSQNDGNVICTDYEYGFHSKDAKIVPARGYIGGITGSAQGIVSNNVNQGTITGNARTGGIVGYATKVTIKGNLSTGLAFLSAADDTKGAVVGSEAGTDNKYENNFYDGSINVNGGVNSLNKAGVTSLSTTALVNGSIPSGLNSELFKAEAGKYPVLKNFADEAASKALSETYIKFDDGEKANDIHGNVQLSTATNLTWKLTTGKNFSIDGSTLKLTSTATDELATDTLIATNGNYQKVYYIGAIPKILSGSGTKDDPFRINSEADLNKIANFITSTGVSFKDYYFKVLNDIDYSGDTLKVIAPNGYSFDGDFNGNGKTISGYVFDDQNFNTGRFIGFFGTVGSNGYIHDLTLNGKISVNEYGASAVAKLYGTIRNVVNKGTITSTKYGYTSGLVGDLFDGALVDSCRNEGALQSTSSYTSGLVNRMYKGSCIRNSSNIANLTSTKNTLSGVVGQIVTGGTIDHVYNSGNLTSTSSTVSGIVSTVNTKAEYAIKNSFNLGEITGSSTVAGIVCNVRSQAVGVIDSCYNTGAINGSSNVGGVAYSIGAGTKISHCYNTGTITGKTGSYTAGVVAYLNGTTNDPDNYQTSADHLYNIGDVTSAGSFTGGVFGAIGGTTEYPVISDSYNLGTVISSRTTTAITTVGGFSGYVGGNIVRCWNAGDVSTDGYGAAGIGSNGEARIEDCFNVGNIQASATKLTNALNYGIAGGIMDYGKSHIYNSYNLGEISGPFALGGIEGSAAQTATFVNNYNAGKITTTTNNDKTSNLVSVDSNTLTKLDSIANNYYDNSVNSTYDFDSQLAQAGTNYLSGLPTSSMYNAPLGDHFAYNRAAYPVIKTIEEPAVQNFFAADTLFIGNDDAQHVTQKFYVGALDSVEWTSSPNIVISDNGEATGIQAGTGWVKKSVSFKGVNFEKQYDVNIVTTTGINEININADDTGLDRNKPMYNVAGQQVGKDYQGVVIQKGHKYVIK